MEDIVNVISTVGFPIAVASYVLLVLNKTMQENTLVLTKLIEKIDTIGMFIEK